MKNKFLLNILGATAIGGAAYWYNQRKIIPFRATINTTLSQQELWQLLEIAFTDSKDCPIWPNELETIQSKGLKENANIWVDYGGDKIFNYRITELHPGEQFSYKAQNHPLQGGATISLLSRAEGGTQLVWEGEYSYTGFSKVALGFQLFFKDAFFNALENNIKEYQSVSLQQFALN